MTAAVPALEQQLTSPAPRLLRPVPSDPPYEDPDEGGAADNQEVGGYPVWTPPLRLRIDRLTALAVVDLPELALLVTDEERGGDSDERAVDADLRRLFGHHRTPRAELPEPGPRAAAAVRLLLEVLTGERPTRQVAGWVSPRVLAGLECRSPLQHRALPRRPLLKSLRVTEPADGVAEVSAVIDTGSRHRAVALRLDGLDGRWTVTALHIG
jgi:hypothetical protein